MYIIINFKDTSYMILKKSYIDPKGRIKINTNHNKTNRLIIALLWQVNYSSKFDWITSFTNSDFSSHDHQFIVREDSW